MKISKKKADIMCFWIHKGLRWSEDPEAHKAWVAIKNLKDGEWERICTDAVKEANNG